MASMTDLIFLLLIFFMVTSTLATPNAVKVDLPEGKEQASEKPVISVTIDENQYFYVGDNKKPVEPDALQDVLLKELEEKKDPTIVLHGDKTAHYDNVMRVINLAKRHNWRMILATQPGN